MSKHSQNNSFADLGLSPKLLTILETLQFHQPTPVQAQAIPVAVEGSDVIGIAQTGTGKTLAFVLPMLQQIARTNTQGFIILPTRELAQQVEEQIKMVGKSLGIRTALVIGGAPVGRQIKDLRNQPHIVIGTPGRIVQLLNQKDMAVDKVGTLVLDEADRMLDMGFAPDLTRILKQVPKSRQTMLFSATMPSEITKMAMRHMKKPFRIEIARAGSVTETVSQEMIIIRRNDKLRLLDKLLDEYTGRVLVFVRTKRAAKTLHRAVKGMGHAAAEIHSNLSQGQRRRSLAGFKSGKFRVMIATDIAARGIDVEQIELVINFDLPDNPDDYVHRVGRTGRANKSGWAISFVTPDQKDKLRAIERLVKLKLPPSSTPELPAARPKVDYPSGGSSRGKSGGRKQRGGQQRQRRGRRNGGGGRQRSNNRSGSSPRVHL